VDVARVSRTWLGFAWQDTLEQQLDNMCSIMLDYLVKIDVRAKTLVLPKVSTRGALRAGNSPHGIGL
jgi:hypothetical protein